MEIHSTLKIQEDLTLKRAALPEFDEGYGNIRYVIHWEMMPVRTNLIGLNSRVLNHLPGWKQ